MIPDGRVGDGGEIPEIDPPRRLVLSWRNEFIPEMREEGFSRMTYELEQKADAVKLTVIHEMDRDDSKLIRGVSTGWPLAERDVTPAGGATHFTIRDSRVTENGGMLAVK
jgi:uncharacterized protein YndB with AHSA1/START domain